jgi:hypothetical protein
VAARIFAFAVRCHVQVPFTNHATETPQQLRDRVRAALLRRRA